MYHNHNSNSQNYYCFLRFVVVIFNEMKIQEDFVYDKTGSNLLGFVNLGDLNDDLLALERQFS